MTHFYVFCYIAALLTGVVALTVQLLSDRCDVQKKFGLMKQFVIIILIVDVYDFVIYYNDHIMYLDESRLIISFGGCLIALFTTLWTGVLAKVLGSDRHNRLSKVFRIYALFYICGWFLSAVLFPGYRWIRILLDIPIFLGLFVGSSYLIWQGRQYESKQVTDYKILITILLSLDAVTYFLRETGIDHGEVMDLTIIYLLLINIANIVLLYFRDFTVSSKSCRPDENQVWHHIAETYQLTEREVEVLRKVYGGEKNIEIAEQFFISERTVKAHIHNIFRKMEVKNRVEAFCMIRDLREKYKSLDD